MIFQELARLPGLEKIICDVFFLSGLFSQLASLWQSMTIDSVEPYVKKEISYEQIFSFE